MLSALLPLFVASGMCALIYEIVWFQLLELVIGSTAVSLGVLLATFMGGMCLGSLLMPRLVPRHVHPLRVYAMLELAIGVVGLVVLFAVPLVGRMYTVGPGHGLVAIFLRALVCAVCLLPPTVLMGATLPAAARWIEATPHGVSWVGFLYGSNTVGAVLGSLLAGFYLLRVHDLTTATLVAAVTNAAIAAIALALAKRTPGTAGPEVHDATQVPRAPGAWAVYATIALSGACALGAEVVWTRLLSLMLGATVYTFSMILAVFLGGLGLGSAAGAWMARTIERPRVALGWCQLLQTAAVAWAAIMIADALPYWPINPSLAPSPWFTLQLDLTRSAWAVFPAACLWGASFPLALAAAAARGQDPSRLVSGVYAANTIGAIVGSLGFSLVLIPLVGTQRSQQILIALSALSAVVVFASLYSAQPAAADAGVPARRPLGPIGTASVVGALIAALIAMAKLPSVPGLLIAYGRYMVTWLGQVDVVYVGEGMNSSVAVTKLLSNGATQFHVSGKVEASTLSQDMRLQRMLATLPALAHASPKSVLVVGFGAGVTAGSFVPYPEMERLVICEIEPLIPMVVSRYFSRENNDVLHDRRTAVFYDDARSFMLTSKEKFDIITSDPIHPWVKGAASLYTKEYFESVKRHLNPGGVVSQWVPLYESNADAVKSEIATFLEVFPNGTLWANNLNGEGYDLVLLGQAGPLTIDMRALRERFGAERYVPVEASLREVGFNSIVDVFSTYAGDGPTLEPWLHDASINRDRNLRLQYLAAVGLNRYQSKGIFDEIVAYRRFPDSIFVAGDPWKETLRQAIEGNR
jgi:spermidine synthase